MSEAQDGWEFSITSLKIKNDEFLPENSDSTFKATLSLSLPGLGLPSDLYNEISLKLEKLSNKLICGYLVGNSCHFSDTCANVLSHVNDNPISIKFFNLNQDSIVLPLEALMREADKNTCRLLITNLGNFSINKVVVGSAVF